MKTTAQEINREFFERNPQAAELRAACIDFLRTWKQLSEASGLDRAVSESNLEAACERLIGHGATPGMHVGQNFEFFRTRPLAAAQFCAGQLLKRDSTEADTAPLKDAYFKLDDVGSSTIAEGVEATILQPERLGNAKLIHLCATRDVVLTVAMLLDAEMDVLGV